MSAWSEWFQNIYNSLFGSSSTTGTISNTSKTQRSTPKSKNLTFPDTINSELTRGLWHNSIVGYKLGAGLCYNPIKIPLSFMGVPHFDIQDQDKVNSIDFWVERLDFYNEQYIKERQNIQLLSHRDGTAIIWPWFDSKKGVVKWKYIKPDSISKVIVDPNTEEIKAIITSEIIYYYNGAGISSNFTEQRIYSEDRTIVKRSGAVPAGVNLDEVKRNPIKILPVFFCNDREQDEIEGHSDYERIISYIKAYAEVNKKAHEDLMNMGSKLIQETDDVATWLSQNGFVDITDVDVSTVDFIINRKDKESSKFEIPKDLIQGHLLLMENDFKNIVESSGIPEIVWGLKMQGNHASAEEQMGVLLSFVDDKQRQANSPYRQLIEATLKLEGIANNQVPPETISISWNDLDSLNEVERSTIFKNWADGVSTLLEKKSIDLQSAHKLLFNLTNGQITPDFEDFKKQVTEYGVLSAYLEQEYLAMRETGANNEPNLDDINKTNKNNGNGHNKKLKAGLLI